MQALFNVSTCAGETDFVSPLNGTVRKYFIAAELVQWNYAPSGIDSLTNVSLNESERLELQCFVFYFITTLNHS